MARDDSPFERRSIRLPNYDYSQTGAYFITICTLGRRNLLGEMVGDGVLLNANGEIAVSGWQQLPERFPSVTLDQFVVMSNHIHGIVVISNTAAAIDAEAAGAIQGRAVGAIHELPHRAYPPDNRTAAKQDSNCENTRQIRGNRRDMLLPKVIGYYKMNVARRINDAMSVQGRPLWQRDYYEHVVRNDRELDAIRKYIVDNPLRWAADRDNPDAIPDKDEEQFWRSYGLDGAKASGHRSEG